MRLFQLAAAATLFLATVASAQPLTTAFSFQGQLQSAGSPANGLYDLRFRLYDSLLGGVQQGPTLCSNNVTVSQGVFATQLDFGAVFVGAQRFIEVDVRQDAGLDCTNSTGFTTLGPRQAVIATPNASFALASASAATAANATNAASLNGQTASFYANAANLSSGVLPSARLSGTYTATLNLTSASNTLAGSGAAITALNAANVASGTLPDARLSPNVPLLNSANTFTGTQSSFAAGLALGTATPNTNTFLDVEGGAPNFYTMFVRGDHGGRILINGGIGNAESTGGTINIAAGQSGFSSTNVGILGASTTIAGGRGGSVSGGDFAGDGGPLILRGGDGGSGGFDNANGGDVYILPGDPGFGSLNNGFPGRIGIGTQTPERFVHIFEGPAGVGDPFGSTIAVESDGPALIGFLAPATSSSGLEFAGPNGADAAIFYNRGSATRSIQLCTGGFQARLTVATDGKVGIGTATPDSPFQVQNGSAGTVSAVPNTVASFERSGAAYLSVLTPAANERGIVFGDPSNAADVGVIANSSGEPHGMEFRTGGNAARVGIDSTGNVGIGTAGHSIDARLHVESDNARVMKVDRFNGDGELLAWARDDAPIGSVTVTGGVVTYGAFTGVHYAKLEAEAQVGDLVSMTGNNGTLGNRKDGEVIYGVITTAKANDPAALGVYVGSLKGEDMRHPDDIAQVAAVGNGDMLVVDTGSNIEPGDYLISSNVLGCAMKDDPAYEVGNIIAKAAQRVDWSSVKADDRGIKKAKISVLFTTFARTGAALEDRIRRLESLLGSR
jgi:hypothetical protein